MEGRHALIVKGDVAADEDVEDNAEAPGVDLWAGVDLGVEEFGGGKVERPAEGAETGDGIVEVGEVKVNDFDVAGLGDEDIFDLEVCLEKEGRARGWGDAEGGLLTTMDNIVHMTILESAAGRLSGDTFAETTMANDEIEHLPAVDVFEHHRRWQD